MSKATENYTNRPVYESLIASDIANVSGGNNFFVCTQINEFILNFAFSTDLCCAPLTYGRKICKHTIYSTSYHQSLGHLQAWAIFIFGIRAICTLGHGTKQKNWVFTLKKIPVYTVKTAEIGAKIFKIKKMAKNHFSRSEFRQKQRKLPHL